MSQTISSNLRQEIKQLIISAAQLPIDESEIHDDAPIFQDGLGLDSIDLLELVVSIDKKYGVKLENDEKGRAALASIASLVHAIEAHQSK